MPHPDDRDKYYRKGRDGKVQSVTPAKKSRFTARAEKKKQAAAAQSGQLGLDLGYGRTHNEVYMALPKDPVTGLRPDYEQHRAEWEANQQ